MGSGACQLDVAECDDGTDHAVPKSNAPTQKHNDVQDRQARRANPNINKHNCGTAK